MEGGGGEKRGGEGKWKVRNGRRRRENEGGGGGDKSGEDREGRSWEEAEEGIRKEKCKGWEEEGRRGEGRNGRGVRRKVIKGVMRVRRREEGCKVRERDTEGWRAMKRGEGER